MPTELVTAATILAGSGTGTWLADKLLGPSFENLGEQIQLYAGDRLAKIFRRTRALTDGRDVNRLAPGFAMVVLQRASISEDAPEITEMWANLIASAAAEQSSRHVIYVDILSQIGRQEALILERMDRRRVANFPEHQRRELASFQIKLQQLEIGCGYGDEDTDAKIDTVLRVPHDVLGDISTVELVNKRDGEAFTVLRRVESAISYDILERQRLVQTSIITVSGAALAPKVSFATLTDLGDDFVRTCRDESETQSSPATEG